MNTPPGSKSPAFYEPLASVVSLDLAQATKECGPLNATSTATETAVPGSVLDMAGCVIGTAAFVVTETGGVNGVTVILQTSNDQNTWIDGNASQIQPGTAGSFGAGPVFNRYIRIAVSDLVSGDHGTISVTGYAS